MKSQAKKGTAMREVSLLIDREGSDNKKVLGNRLQVDQ